MYLLRVSQMLLENTFYFHKRKKKKRQTGLQVNNNRRILCNRPKLIKPLAELIFSWFFFTLSISGVMLKAVALPS